MTWGSSRWNGTTGIEMRGGDEYLTQSNGMRACLKGGGCGSLSCIALAFIDSLLASMRVVWRWAYLSCCLEPVQLSMFFTILHTKWHPIICFIFIHVHATVLVIKIRRLANARLLVYLLSKLPPCTSLLRVKRLFPDVREKIITPSSKTTRWLTCSRVMALRGGRSRGSATPTSKIIILGNLWSSPS